MVRSSEHSKEARRQRRRVPGSPRYWTVSGPFWVRVGVSVRVRVRGLIYVRALIPPTEVIPSPENMPDPWNIDPKS